MFSLTLTSSGFPHFPSLYFSCRWLFVVRYSKPNSSHGVSNSAVPGAFVVDTNNDVDVGNSLVTDGWIVWNDKQHFDDHNKPNNMGNREFFIVDDMITKTETFGIYRTQQHSTSNISDTT